MTKLCPRGKAAAKRKFDVYPSAYANAYASKICAGKIKDPSGVKRKDFKGRKPAAMGGMMRPGYSTGELVAGTDNIGEFEKKVRDTKAAKKFKLENPGAEEKLNKLLDEKKITRSNTRTKFKASGGRVTLKNGGRVARGCGAVMSNRRKVTKIY